MALIIAAVPLLLPPSRCAQPGELLQQLAQSRHGTLQQAAQVLVPDLCLRNQLHAAVLCQLLEALGPTLQPVSDGLVVLVVVLAVGGTRASDAGNRDSSIRRRR